MNGIAVLLVFLPHLLAGYLNDTFGQTHCDPSLPLITNNELGYRDRGDRCEGTYIKQVGSTTLYVASFTELFEQFDPKSGTPLQIEWDNLANTTGVHIRAQAVKQKVYYRMDSFRPATTASFNWPTNILASLNILKKDIGVIGTARVTIGQVQRDVYLPLRIRQQSNATRTGIYNLVLLPGVELSEIYISLAPVASDGRPQKFIREGEKMGYGYYPAERIIEIPITGLGNAGMYYLEVGASLRNGGTSTLELWFYKEH